MLAAGQVLRNDWQRQAGWSLDSWAEDTPIPRHSQQHLQQGNRNQGMFMNGCRSEGREQSMADTLRHSEKTQGAT